MCRGGGVVLGVFVFRVGRVIGWKVWFKRARCSGVMRREYVDLEGV